MASRTSLEFLRGFTEFSVNGNEFVNWEERVYAPHKGIRSDVIFAWITDG